MNAIAIMGIHTGIGKTITSAVLTEALQADYWKPVQAGELDNTDSMKVRSLLSNTKSVVHNEAIRLTQPMSPHAAAHIDGVDIDISKFKWPDTNNLLIVETAGGVHSPMNDNNTMADFVEYYKLPVVLVTQHYLGSINHTLLSIEVMMKRGINIKGIIVNGSKNDTSESFITSYSHLPILAHIPTMEHITQLSVKSMADSIQSAIQKSLS